MDSIFAAHADQLMSSTYSSSAQLDQFARDSLSHGITLYMNGDYKGAIKEFQRSVGLSPYGEYSNDASNYMANAYTQLGEYEKAISTYEKAIRLNPTYASNHISLGNLYFGLDRFEEAKEEYEEAVRIDGSPTNYFSLGQAYLRLDRFGEAENTFSKVKRMEPKSPGGEYGLGLTFSKMGRHEKAIEHFEEAVRLDREFYDGYAEIGYSYMDMGEKDKAMEIIDFLEQKDISLAYTLSEYVYQKDAPNFSVCYYTEAFGAYPAKTLVSSMDAYLQNANASKIFTLNVSFDKEMDRESVENLSNWGITRAIGSGPGESYNYSMNIPSTEVNLQYLPVNVYYDEDTWTARVKFKITQNATADGTIDPGHVEFKFMGEDIYGNQMDPTGDQYSAFSGIA